VLFFIITFMGWVIRSGCHMFLDSSVDMETLTHTSTCACFSTYLHVLCHLVQISCKFSMLLLLLPSSGSYNEVLLGWLFYSVCGTFGTHIFSFSNSSTYMSSLLEVDYKGKYFYLLIILTDLKYMRPVTSLLVY
jgi:hypothetical protein